MPFGLVHTRRHPREQKISLSEQAAVAQEEISPGGRPRFTMIMLDSCSIETCSKLSEIKNWNGKF